MRFSCDVADALPTNSAAMVATVTDSILRVAALSWVSVGWEAKKKKNPKKKKKKKRRRLTASQKKKRKRSALYFDEEFQLLRCGMYGRIE
jgi:hypothetical protein